MEESIRQYDGLTYMYVPKDEDPDASGLYLRAHEVIAMMRNEAILSTQDFYEGVEERADDALESLADALAESVVAAMDQFGEMGIGPS